MNAHFKPFAAIGYEYNKVRPNSGNPQFGSSIQFSIPQFGDFFNDMVLHIVLDEVSATAGAVGSIPAFPAAIGPNDAVVNDFSSTSADQDFPVNNDYTQYRYEYVDFQGRVINRTNNTYVDDSSAYVPQNFVRYAEFPGQRLLKNVKFEVNGNPLDEYTAEAQLFHQKFRVAPGKLTGWKRLVGQEQPIDAYSDLCSVAGTSSWCADHVGLLDAATQTVPAPVSPVNAAVTSRQLSKVVSGPQTPQHHQHALDLWVPLLFWFNKDARLSIASVSIPYGQRFITVDLEAQGNMVFVAPGNLFLRLTTSVTSNADGTAAGDAITAYRQCQSWLPVVVPSSIVNQNQQITVAELYINNIFVNPEINVCL